MTGLAKQIVAAPAFQRVIFAVVLLAGVLAGLETSNSFLAAYGPLLKRFNLLEEQLNILRQQAAKLKTRLAHESGRTGEARFN